MIPRREYLPSGRLIPLLLDSSEDVDRYADELGMRRDEAWAMVRRGEIVLRTEAKEPETDDDAFDRSDLYAACFCLILGVSVGIVAYLFLS